MFSNFLAWVIYSAISYIGIFFMRISFKDCIALIMTGIFLIAFGTMLCVGAPGFGYSLLLVECLVMLGAMLFSIGIGQIILKKVE